VPSPVGHHAVYPALAVALNPERPGADLDVDARIHTCIDENAVEDMASWGIQRRDTVAVTKRKTDDLVTEPQGDPANGWSASGNHRIE
jgi:hypothetical protein